MSNEPEPKEVEYDPNSLRNTLRIALGAQWTHELEDKLFWPVSMFCTAGCERIRKDTLEKIQRALGLRQ
jgi:hypothetical protein